LLDSIVDQAVFLVDSDGRTATWNPGAEQLTGYSASEVIGRHVSVLYSPDAVATGQPERHLERAARAGRSRREARWIRKEGSGFAADVIVTALCEDDGPLRGFGYVVRELAHQRVTGEEVRGTEESLRLMVESVVDYAIFMLDTDGRVATWNEGAHQLKQYEADEIRGRHFSVFYLPEDRTSGKPERLLAEAARDGRVEDEGWRMRKDGSRFWADVVITALRTPDGELRGYAKVTRDRTERKQAEEAMREMATREREAGAQLSEANRGRQGLIAMVAHDLRTPVGVVHGTADMLLRDWDHLDDGGRIQMIRMILSTTTRLSALVDDVLDMARIESGQLRYERGVLDLVTTVLRAAGDIDPTRERIVVVPRADDVQVRGDERRVWQIITNLLSNAMKFSPGTEQVEVSIEAEDQIGRVSVTDHGSGIAEDDQRKLFEPFSRIGTRRTAAGEGGTGLGLYIARSLVTAQGGQIGATSTVGAGSTFSFTLPLAL
jgi:PAS domain S-box-containing protein